MFKLRLIAAAALASIMVPSVAAAADARTERAKYLVQQRDGIAANRDRIKALIKSHQGDRADLMQRLANLNGKLTTLNQRIQAIRDGRASV